MSKLPTDPNERAHAIAGQITGPTESKPLPAHVSLSGDALTCAKCGASFKLSKRENARASETRAFAAIHEHA